MNKNQEPGIKEAVVSVATDILDPFDKSFAVEYELARRLGDRRFGSECKHGHVENNHCVTCLRRVV